MTKMPRLGVNQRVLDWARRDPDGLLAAAQLLAERRQPGNDPDALQLWNELRRIRSYPFFVEWLLRARPEALVEAVRIVIERPAAVQSVLRRYSYTDPDSIGGPLDNDLAR